MPFGPNGFPKSGFKMTWVHGRCTTLHSNIDPKTRLKRVKHIPGQTHKHVFYAKTLKAFQSSPTAILEGCVQALVCFISVTSQVEKSKVSCKLQLAESFIPSCPSCRSWKYHPGLPMDFHGLPIDFSWISEFRR